MAPICAVCSKNESKYKCPTCGLRYCSLECYKSHRAIHPETKTNEKAAEDQPGISASDRPGTRQRIAKPDFSNFQNDQELTRLLTRYPSLKPQLQAVYAMTLEPGPEDARTWNKPAFKQHGHHGEVRGAMKGRMMRGRGGRRGNFGGSVGRRGRWFDPMGDEGQHGAWTREKGDKEAMRVLRIARNGWDGDEDRAEGVKEFVELCRMRFGTTRAVD